MKDLSVKFQDRVADLSLKSWKWFRSEVQEFCQTPIWYALELGWYILLCAIGLAIIRECVIWAMILIGF